MKRRYRVPSPAKRIITATAISLATVLVIGLIMAIISSRLENSRSGIELLSLITLLISGVISGFVAMRLSHSFMNATLSLLFTLAIFALCAIIGYGYSLGALMNEVCYFLASAVGMTLGRYRKRGRGYSR